MFDNVTHYCVRYDPATCSADPERIWALCQGEGLAQGYVHARAAGELEFLVPARAYSLVMLLEPNLQPVPSRNLIDF